MSTKTLIWIGVTIGSTAGGFLPALWGEGFLSISGLFFSGVGAMLGIWLGYKAGNSF